MRKRRQGSRLRAAFALAIVYVLALQPVLSRVSAAALGLQPTDIICSQSADGEGGSGHGPAHLTDCCLPSIRFQFDAPTVVATSEPIVFVPQAVSGKVYAAVRQSRAPPSRSVNPNRPRGPPTDLV